jgi:hypothetical protein
MSCNFAAEHHFHSTATDLIMKPLMLTKDEPDCDHVSESNYDDRHHTLSFKNNAQVANDEIDSENEVQTISK